MNDRIKELADRASEHIRYKIDPHTFKHIDDPNGPYIRVEFNKEKFAELIVRECVNEIHVADVGDLKGKSYYLDKVAEHIENHFGVEE